MHRSIPHAALLLVAFAAPLTAQAQAQAPAAAPAATPAPRRGAAPVVAAPAKPVPPPPPALPDPPIPSQHLAQAGIGQCIPGTTQVAQGALAAPSNAQSTWNQVAPTQHVFQSVVGIKNSRNNPPGGMVAIIAAPLPNDKCDVVAMEVYPLAGSCAEVQRVMAKGGEVETALEDIKVITDVQKRRLFLMPGFGNTCVAVSVNSFFAP